jgi:hypothetical protein
MPNLTTSPPNRSVSPNPVVDRLFARLHAMYGKAWLDLWANADMGNVKAVWSDSLRNASMGEMRLALAELEKNGSPFPPNLPEFSALCRQFKSDRKPNLYLTAPRTQAPDGAFQSLRNILRKASEQQ